MANIPNHLFFLLLLIITILSGCNHNEVPTSQRWQEFCCRDTGDPKMRVPLYRGKVPSHWQRKDPAETESIADTTKPIAEFRIGNHEEEHVYLTLFTFPVETYTQRIPPSAQLERWKRQFDEFDSTSLSIEPYAHGGYVGLSIYAKGTINQQERSLLGFSMQLASIHWFTLQNYQEHPLKQMSADYTIKATGSPSAIQKWKEEIKLFANSFELIEEIPIR